MRYLSLNLILLLLLSSPLTYSADHNVLDSLRLALTGKTIQERFNSFVDAGILYVDRNNELALAIIEDAEREAILAADSSLIILCWRIKGQILYRLERTDEAMQLFETALPAAERNGLDRERMKLLTTYGVHLSLRSQYDKALRNYFDAQELAANQNDSIQQGMLLQNIGIVYYKLKDYKKALFYWKEASGYKTPRQYLSASHPTNISLCYANLGDFKTARKYLNESVRVCGAECSDVLIMHIKYASGFIFLGQELYDSSEHEILQSYKYAEKIGHARMKLDNIYILTEVYQKQNRVDDAFFYLIIAERLIEDGIPYNLEIIKIYSRLAEFHLMTGNFEKAALYQAKYISLKDSIYDESLTTSLMKVEAEHLEKVNEAQIATQKEMILLKEQVIDRQLILNIVTTLLATIVFLFSIFIYRSYRQKKKLSVLLDRRVRERTFELESSYNDLVTALREQDLVVTRMAQGAGEIVTTIRGLCVAAKTEVMDGVSQSYFDRIDHASGLLNEHFRCISAKNDSVVNKSLRYA